MTVFCLHWESKTRVSGKVTECTSCKFVFLCYIISQFVWERGWSELRFVVDLCTASDGPQCSDCMVLDAILLS